MIRLVMAMMSMRICIAGPSSIIIMSTTIETRHSPNETINTEHENRTIYFPTLDYIPVPENKNVRFWFSYINTYIPTYINTTLLQQHFCIPAAHGLTPLATSETHDSPTTHGLGYIFLIKNGGQRTCADTAAMAFLYSRGPQIHALCISKDSRLTQDSRSRLASEWLNG